MENNVYTIGFSPCPNDTFIFDAMVHAKVDTEGLSFDYRLEDVETLNKHAFGVMLDISKVSFHAFVFLTENYQLLNAGSALGKNCGPLLISLEEYSEKDISSNLKIGIPGKYTTANFLMSIAFPHATKKVEMMFNEIENALISKQIDAGLIIHENRFTYEQKGLRKILDLGEYWENTFGLPIPLGGIIVRKEIADEAKRKIDRVLKRSIEFAFAHPESSAAFVKKHAREMQPEVLKKHIALYVNEYSKELGNEGRKAVQCLFEKALECHLITKIPEKIFVD